MAESKSTPKLTLKRQSGSNSARHATKLKAPREVFAQLIGKADNLPAELSTKKSRVLSES